MSVLSKQQLITLLDQIEENIDALGVQYIAEKEKLAILVDRLIEERFHLAVLGQFKRGKSTLLNALLGDEVLPSAVLPLTAIPTYLLWAEELRVCIKYIDGRRDEEKIFSNVREMNAFLREYVTEEGNPRNKKGVACTEVYYPSPLLKRGVVLIDTPGIGSTLRHNTQVTHNILTECDAALFVISADPPVTELELEFLKLVKNKIKQLFFIINKIDYLNEQEKDSVLAFFKGILVEDVNIDNPQILCVSARRGLEAKLSKDTEKWKKSGMHHVSDNLVDFLSKEKAKAHQKAVANRGYDIISDVIMRLNINIKSLEMSLTELDKRIKAFEEKLREIKGEKSIIADMLEGDKKRTKKYLTDEADKLRLRAERQIKELICAYIEELFPAIDEGKIQGKLDDFIPTFFEKELSEMAQKFNTRVGEVLSKYQDRVDELIEAIRKTAAELFKIPYYAPSAKEIFQMRYLPYWVNKKYGATLSPIPKSLVYSLLPSRIKKAKLTKQYNEQAEILARNNVENLRWAILQNTNEAFRKFSHNLEERMEKTIEATHGAITATYNKRLAESEEITSELEKLQDARNLLSGLQEQLKKYISL